MRFVTDEDSKKAYKQFLEKHERCNFQQSLEWGNVKTNWIKEVVLAENENKEITLVIKNKEAVFLFIFHLSLLFVKFWFLLNLTEKKTEHILILKILI